MVPIRRSTLAVLLMLTLGLAIATVSFISSVVQPSATLGNGGNLTGNPRAQYASAYGAYPLSDFTTAVGNGMVVGHDYHHDTTTVPLRDMPQLPIKGGAEHESSPNPSTSIVHKNTPDGSVVQHSLAPNAMPTPILNFDGIPISCGCAPPDTNGAVGTTQYVQMVNNSYQVFNKTTGTSLLGPASINSVWNGFGGVCTSGSGDPIVLYDKLANRWLISQFAGSGGAITDECIAVSTSNDATGTWNRYGFHLGSNFFDYPHLGTWPDAYYQSDNVFSAAGNQYLGPQPFAFDRTAMIAGGAATFVSPVGSLGANVAPMLPADIDGSNLPTNGAAETFVGWPSGNVYNIYHFHVDFVTPANSTFTTFATPPAAGFSRLCSGNRACVPESGVTTSSYIDGIGDRLMFRAAYRKFADGHEALITNYTVSSGGVAGVRWIELDNVTAGPVTVAQESTYQPDTTWRWMGSIAMDHNGDIAVGFSASSASIFPQIRYAGRLVTDPINTLAQGEATLFSGTGSQTGTFNRWGDYSDMTVDPTDDCTFWYTQEYYATTGSFNWRTRIGNFKFPSCLAATPTPTITPGGPTNTPTNTPTRTNTPTNTLTNTLTNTPTNTPTNTNTPTRTSTSTLTNTPTNTPTITNTPTNTPTITNTPTNTPSNTPTITTMPTSTPTNALTGTSTNTPTNTPMATNTTTATPNSTATSTATGTATSTATSPTNTPLPPTSTPIATNPPSLTSTPPATNTPPLTSTPNVTSTPSLTATPTASTIPLITATPTDCANPFVDTQGNVFYTAIHYLNCRGVINGTDATHYTPAGTSTRGQFAKVVVLGFGTPFYTPATQDFVDVPPSYFAYIFIESGFHGGILSGFDPASCQAAGQPYPCYLPNRPITRGQLTKLVVNAAGYPLYTPTGGQQTFSDVPPSNVFFVSIETAHQKGVINGYPDGSFRPNNNIRRDEMAQIVYKGVTTP